MSRRLSREAASDLPLIEPAPGAVGESEPAPAPGLLARAAGWKLPHFMRAGAPAWIWFGVGVSGLGFLLLAVAWGGVADETEVYLQVPYLVSAGLVGLGLIMVGLTALNLAARHRDAIDRDAQIDQLVAVIEELKATLAEREEGRPRRGSSRP